MRLWSIHPKYLDGIGLVALWREALLAKKVLEGKTKGYKNHPQLERFRKTKDPIAFINKYLEHVYIEAVSRGYNFDVKKIKRDNFLLKINVTSKQVEYETEHIYKKLQNRAPQELKRIEKNIKVNPIFKVVEGEIENWEKSS